MKGDFSRRTFDKEKHYSGVQMQQGRVQLDADWNEQGSIQRHRVQSESADVVGPSGAPNTAPGFGISVQGNNLVIGDGHFYIDGLLCENEQEVSITEQPDLPPLLDTDVEVLPTADGLYVVYLEAWDRHISVLEDPSIRESALGGPDTATRSKTVRQVKMLEVTDPGGTVRCDTAFAEWDELRSSNLLGISNPGRVGARSEPDEVSPDPLCILPPSAGYRRLENQLYRVEVHRGGTRDQATFKWSRDNGTVASAIQLDQDGDVISGNVITVAELGKDGTLTFASDPLPEWLELTDDSHELWNQHGALVRVGQVEAATRTITFSGGGLPALDAQRHPLVRRWDQFGNTATADGVAMTGDWQALESGVQVRFEEGVYRVGDYWLIPARSAVGFETGNIEWPMDGSNPALVVPEGTRHRLARLALVRRTAGSLALVPDGDCRNLFPPLTAITAADVSFSDSTCQFGTATNVQQALNILCQRNTTMCTLLVGPGEDLTVAIESIGNAQDALICLRSGDYTLSRPVDLSGRRHVQVLGAGWSTRILAPQHEFALRFRNCTSVMVSNLYVETRAPDPVGAGGLVGSLGFVDCRSVKVANVSVRNAAAAVRASAAIGVRNSVGTGAGSSASIHGCLLEPGHLQTGVLLVNVDRIRVTDNTIRPGIRPPNEQLLTDPVYRGILRRHLISGIVGGNPPPTTNATVTYNNVQVHLRSDPSLVGTPRTNNDWQRAIDAFDPPRVGNVRAMSRALLDIASDLIARRGVGLGGSVAFRNAIEGLLAQDVLSIDQGIVAGGQLASDVRISGNSVGNAIQGIHVGLGDRRQDSMAGVVLLEDNVIRVSLPSTAVRERHAIFVGSCNSLVVQNNFASLGRVSRTSTLRVEGIRIFGLMGRRVVVRQNHMGPAFNVGITFAPLNTTIPPQPGWIITENMMEAATTTVDIPARQPGQAGPATPTVVRQRVRGIIDNFA